jgi:hypothetical protein
MSISLDQQARRVKISAEINNDIVFGYFDKLGKDEREDKLATAIYIGVLAQMEDRLSAFLSKTANELGTELESLKKIFDLRRELFFKSTTSGVVAESDIAEFLNEHFKKQGFKDQAELTGNQAGQLARNKTGDIVCAVNGTHDLRIVIECKFDAQIKFGDIKDKDIFARNADTAWSQLIEAAANRDGKVAIIVFDDERVDPKIRSIVQNVKYIPEIGFIAIVRSQAGDYANLAIAYALARDIAVNAKTVTLDKDLLSVLLNRILGDLEGILEIRDLVEANIEHNKKILKQLEKSLLSMEFSRQYLGNFLKEGTLTKGDLLEFYRGGDLRDRFKAIEQEINLLGQ